MDLGETFFKGFKKQMRLDKYEQLKSKGDEKRKKLILSMEFDEQTNLPGMPGWIADEYAMLQKDDCLITRVVYGRAVMEGMTLEIFATDTNSRPAFTPLSGCQCKNFALSKEGLGEKAHYYLEFQVYTQDPLELHDWCRTHYHGEFFARFEQGQTKLDFAGSEPEADSDRENEDTLSPSRDEEFAPKGSKKKVAVH